MRPLVLFGVCLSACAAAQPATVPMPAPAPAPVAAPPVAAASATVAPPVPGSAARAKPFLKGQTHVHSNRSYDARTPPEQVVKFYRDRGYDFLVLTDHNRVTALPSPEGMLVFAGVELSQNSATCDPKPSPGYRCLFHLSGLFVDPTRDAKQGERIPLQFRPGRLDAYRAELAIVRELGGAPVLNHPLFHFAADARLVRSLSADGVRRGPGTRAWTSGDDSEQDGSSVGAFRAASEEHVEPELREVLELALGGRVVDRHLRVVDESEESFAMISIVANCCAQQV